MIRDGKSAQAAIHQVRTHVVTYTPADLDTSTGGPYGARWCWLEDFAAEVSHGRKRVVGEYCLSGTRVLWQRATSHSAVAAQPEV